MSTTTTDEEAKWLKKFNVPAPKRPVLDRRRILAGFLTGYQWWWHKHPLTGKPILTYVHPATGIKVLPDKEWYAQDFSSFGVAWQSSKSFFEQFRALQLNVPMLAQRNVIEPENSIAMGSFGDVNSYFSSSCESSKDSFFCAWSEGPDLSAEIHNVKQVTQSYRIDDAFNIYNSRYVRDGADILNSAFVFYAKDLEYCFGASCKKHKKFIFFDKQLTKDEYAKEMQSIDLSCRSNVEQYRERFHKMLAEQTIWPQNMNVKDEGSSGEYVISGTNCQFCYSAVGGSHDMLWCSHTSGDSYNNAFCQLIHNTSECYSCVDAQECTGCKFCYACGTSQNLEYCMQCYNCEDCFGCVGLQRKKFHVFNKEYSEEDYRKIVAEIKKAMLAAREYGEFFPLSFSPVYFGQSAAVLYYLATEADGKTLGALDYDPESHGAIGDLSEAHNLKTTKEIPDCIDALEVDDWAGVPVLDEHINRRFAFLKPELEFYKKYRIAPPDHHFVHRIQDMIQESNSAVFEDASCAKCHQTMLVAKNKSFPKRTIYCKACFNTYFEAEG
ncbi:MAG: hypothetical protein AAB448_04515 [Patescibacteria group bacterium]